MSQEHIKEHVMVVTERSNIHTIGASCAQLKIISEDRHDGSTNPEKIGYIPKRILGFTGL